MKSAFMRHCLKIDIASNKQLRQFLLKFLQEVSSKMILKKIFDSKLFSHQRVQYLFDGVSTPIRFTPTSSFSPVTNAFASVLSFVPPKSAEIREFLMQNHQASAIEILQISISRP
jgi:predicted membrane protein